MLGNRLGDPDDVGLLKGIAPQHGPGDLPSDGNDWCAVHVRRGQSSHQVGGAGTRGCDAHTGAAGGPGITIGRMRRGLLVADEHVTEPGVLRQCVIERHDRAAGIAEQQVDALFEQCTAEDLGTGEGLRHAARSRRESDVNSGR